VKARAPSGVFAIALASFLLAFAVRLYWVLHVQSPLDAEYSDMAGYVSRAEWLLARFMPGDPRILTTYPFGTHGILALEFLALGRHSGRAIAVAHALVGAVPAACIPFLMVRLVPRRWAAALAGGLVAVWYPQVCFTGFFLSEIWFSAAIALHACFVAYDVRRTSGQVWASVLASIAFVVRPQFLLTWLFEMGGRTLVLLRRRGVLGTVRGVVWLTLPMALTLAACSVRLHALAGHWGLIAESGINRVWADTDICKLEAHWQTPSGAEFSYWFSPPSKQPCPDSRGVKFTGFIADSKILDAIRAKRLRGVPWWRRLSRMASNADLLIDRNLPWPESNYREPPWRLALQEDFRALLKFVIFPLCLLGLALGPRNKATLILAANLTTVVVAAAIFFGEARYHVPYDPFAIVLAITGAHEVIRRVLGSIRRLQRARLIGPNLGTSHL
jgi:hypothetical protein